MKIHYSDCAVRREPAFRNGPCNCGGLDLAVDMFHVPVALLVTRPGSVGCFICEGDRSNLVEAQDFPTGRFMTDAAAANLPNPHNRLSCCACANCMNFDNTGISIISDFETSAQAESFARS
jgi:hypothetical protein